MTARELYEAVRNVSAREPGLTVVIQTANGGVCGGRKVAARVAAVARGGDWGAGTLIITTEEPVVVVRGLEGDVRDLARATLERMKAAHAMVFCGRGEYIPRAREQTWIDGFCAGVAAHITAAGGTP